MIKYQKYGKRKQQLYTLQEKDSSVKEFSSCRIKFPEKNNRQCMENLLQTGQIQKQVQP